MRRAAAVGFRLHRLVGRLVNEGMNVMTDDEIAKGVRLASDLCREFEGLRLAPYLCPAGKATIGYGSTCYSDGRAVALTDLSINAEQAETMLQADLTATRLPGVLRLCPGIDTPQRLAALLDFAFNAGIGSLETSTLRKRVNDGDWASAAVEMQKWVRGGDRVLPGLVRRRKAAAQLLSPNVANNRLP